MTVGLDEVGGLVGRNHRVVTDCLSISEVSGTEDVGGLVGCQPRFGEITRCYAGGTVEGEKCVGGLVGKNGHVETNADAWPAIHDCYSTGYVSGRTDVGGLVGWDAWGLAESSFWNVEASGQASSAGGMGLTTGQMMTAGPFLAAGWDFVGEAENGTDEIWWIDEGQDTPRLWWELPDEDSL